METWRAQVETGEIEAAWKLFIERYRRLIHAVIRRTLDDEDGVAEVFADVCGDLSRDNLALPASRADSGNARFSTWLVTVVHNRTIDWVRRREGRRRIVAPDGLTPLQQEIFNRIVRERRSHSEAYELIRQDSSFRPSYGEFIREVTATYRALQSSGRPVARFFPGPPMEIMRAEPDPQAAFLLSESASRLAAALKTLSPDERLAVQLFVIDEIPAAQVATIVGWPNAKSVYNRVPRALERIRRELESLGVSREVIE